MSRPKSDTIEALGLEEFLNQRYAAEGGYKRYTEMVTGGQPDSSIAREFGGKRPLHYQTVANWRRAYLEQSSERKA